MTGQGPQSPMPGGLLGVLAVLRFLAEVGLLVALGWVGLRLTDGPAALAVVLALLLPLLAAATWGLWVAPKSRRRLSDPARLAVEVALFGVALFGLQYVGPNPAAATWGVVLCIAYLASAVVGRKGL